ncbi:MAG: hypothetical protein CL596_00525 [Alteromonas sp.]|nr:hypothetical protein [Alteromonas sp.]MAY21840.1 hypothetical protein [Flavobacteriaceae bacterium]|tara:strand:- start:20209 stop:20421 length:213 start_codon:yes stop_codon:yes gene_type:complete
MKKNMGLMDRGIRFIIAIVILTLYFTGKIDGVLAILLLGFALATTFTGISGYCPLYPIFGWNTCKKKEKK